MSLYVNLSAQLLQPTRDAMRVLDALNKRPEPMPEDMQALFHVAVKLVDANKRMVERLVALSEAVQQFDPEAFPGDRQTLVEQVVYLSERVGQLERRLDRH